MAVLLFHYMYGRHFRRERVFRDRTSPFDMYDDFEMIARYRINRAWVLLLVNELKRSLERPTGHSVALPVSLQVFVAFRYFATGSFQSRLADLHVVSVASVSRILNDICRLLSESHHAQLDVKFPESAREISVTKREFAQIANFPGVIGCIDGRQIAIRSPTENEGIYVCWKGFHSLNVQATCDANLRFTSVCDKFPGTAHDAFILQQSFLPAKMEGREYEGSVLLGDSGYPLRRWLLVPFGHPQNQAQESYNRAHKTTRCMIERAFGVAKSRFKCLHHKSGGCLMYTPDVAARMVICVFKLHNLCVNLRLSESPIEDDDDRDNGQQYHGPDNDGKTLRDINVQQRFSL